MNNQEKNKFKMWLLKTKQNRQKIEEKQLGITVYHIFMDEMNKNTVCYSKIQIAVLSFLSSSTKVIDKGLIYIALTDE